MKKTIWCILCVLFFITCKKKDNNNVQFSKLLKATKGENAGIYDTQGRFVMLRGVNYNVLGDYWQANASIPATKNYDAEDIRLMSYYGFNCIRLIFSWSALEPQQGEYDIAYISKIKSIIQEAEKYNMYVMLDMHQDAWGKYIDTPQDSSCAFPNKGWDGAPLWATYTDGASTCTADGRRESAPAVYHAFQNFWDNKNNIQTACINAWKKLVETTAAYDNVVGYDLINEPSLGYKEPLDAENNKMAQFYGNLTQAIRTAESTSGKKHIIFFEPAIQWKGLEQLALVDANFTTDENIVFAPHSYFEAIGNTPFTIEQGFGVLLFGCNNIYKTALFVGEWGFFGDPNIDVSKVKRFAVMEDQNFVSSTWWQWCQAPGDPHGISWDGNNYAATSLHLLEVNQAGAFTGKVNEVYLKVLSRPRPIAIHGKPVKFTSNPDNGNMHLEANADINGITELWVSDFFSMPKVNGSNISVKEIEKVAGGYKVYLEVNNNYTVDVTF